MGATFLRMLALVILALAATGREAIGMIFEAGVWVGALMVVLILGIIGFIAAKIDGRRGRLAPT